MGMRPSDSSPDPRAGPFGGGGGLRWSLGGNPVMCSLDGRSKCKLFKKNFRGEILMTNSFTILSLR